MHKHPDADAFMREYLAQPTDATTRLVFADWLEETGAPHNTAWAYYIRLRDEADRYPPSSREHRELLRQADDYAPKIRAKLTMSATRFVGYPKSLLQLIPAANVCVRLAGFVVPPAVLEHMPESIARENVLLPLDMQGDALLVTIPDPHNAGTAQTLQFILNRYIVLVGADRDEIVAALNRVYGPVEFYDTSVVFHDTGERAWGEWATPEFVDAGASVVQLVNLFLSEAVALRADRLLLYPEAGATEVRVRIDGQWTDRRQFPLRMLRPFVARVAFMARIDADRAFGAEPSSGDIPLQVRGDRVRLRAHIVPSPDGPSMQIDITREPVV